MNPRYEIAVACALLIIALIYFLYTPRFDAWLKRRLTPTPGSAAAFEAEANRIRKEREKTEKEVLKAAAAARAEAARLAKTKF